MRSDKAKNLAKVAKAKIENPFATVREIEEETGVSKSAVSGLTKELPKLDKVGQIQKIIQADMEIVEKSIRILSKRLDLAEEDPKSMSTRDVIASADTSSKRYSLFKGSATDNEGGLKEIKILLPK